MLIAIEFRYSKGQAVTLEFFPEQLLVTHGSHVRGYPWSWLYRDIVKGVVDDFGFVERVQGKLHTVIEATHELSKQLK